MIVSEKHFPKSTFWDQEYLNQFVEENKSQTIALVVWSANQKVIIEQIEYAVRSNATIILSEILPDEIPAELKSQDFLYFCKRFQIPITSIYIPKTYKQKNKSILLIKDSISEKKNTFSYLKYTKAIDFKTFIIDTNNNEWRKVLCQNIQNYTTIAIDLKNPSAIVLIAKICNHCQKELLIEKINDISILRLLFFQVNNIQQINVQSNRSIRSSMHCILSSFNGISDGEIEDLNLNIKIESSLSLIFNHCYREELKCEHINSTNFRTIISDNEIGENALNRFQFFCILNCIKALNEHKIETKCKLYNKHLVNLILDNILFKSDDYYSTKFIHKTLLFCDSLLGKIQERFHYWLMKLNKDCDTHILRLSKVISTLPLDQNTNIHKKYIQELTINILKIESSSKINFRYNYRIDLIKYFTSKDQIHIEKYLRGNDIRSKINQSFFLKVAPLYFSIEKMLPIIKSFSIDIDEILFSLLSFSNIYAEDLSLNTNFIKSKCDSINHILENLEVVVKKHPNDYFNLNLLKYVLSDEKFQLDQTYREDQILSISLISSQLNNINTNYFLRKINPQINNQHSFLNYLFFTILCNEYSLFNLYVGDFIPFIDNLIVENSYVFSDNTNPFIFTCLFVILNEINHPKSCYFQKLSEEHSISHSYILNLIERNSNVK